MLCHHWEHIGVPIHHPNRWVTLISCLLCAAEGHAQCSWKSYWIVVLLYISDWSLRTNEPFFWKPSMTMDGKARFPCNQITLRDLIKWIIDYLQNKHRLHSLDNNKASSDHTTSHAQIEQYTYYLSYMPIISYSCISCYFSIMFKLPDWETR